jgi:hypothetical protein
MTNSDADHMVLAQNIDHNTRLGNPIGLPKASFNKHLLIAGSTGVGKSVTGIHAAFTAHQAIEGATVLIDPKGEWGQQLLQTAHARRGHLDDVLYFDAGETLPAISFFDIEPALDAGRSRGQEVRAVSDHFLTILDHVMASGFDAVRAPDVIRYLIKALYDPLEGSDQTSITELADAIYKLRRSRTTPPVSTDWSEDLLKSLEDGNASMFQTILQGAVTRVEKIYGNGFLRPMFDYVPDNSEEAFRFEDHLSENRFIIFDLGDVRKRSQAIIVNALLSLLWRGLQIRGARTSEDERTQSMLFIDEVPKIGIESRLSELLALSRSYGLGVVAMMQYPKQLKERSEDGENAYKEVLNNCHSKLIGRIPVDEELVNSLQNPAMSQGEIRNRIGNMPKDRWLFQADTPRDTGRMRPTLVADLPLPAGHPEAPQEAKHPDPEAFENALDSVKERTAAEFGVQPDTYELKPEERVKVTGFDLDVDTVTALQDTNFATTLPLVTRLPGGARYNGESHSIECTACGTRYESSFDGLLQAFGCHRDLAEIDRTKIPPVELNLSLNPTEISDAPITGMQIVSLQLLYNIGAGRYDRCEIDLLFDPIPKILNGLGIDTGILSPLVDEGYLTRHQLKDYVYYTVTKQGRDLLEESNRRGIDWGHGEGDITESLLHRALVDAVARYLQEEYVDDPASPASTVVKYYEPEQSTIEQAGLDPKTRFDVVTITDSGVIHGIGEAELSNNDRATAALRDYEKIAAIEPEVALWGVPSSGKGHEAVIQPLSDPPEDVEDSSPRIKSYSESTRIKDMSGFDAPGLTAIKTLSQFRKALTPPNMAENSGPL